MAGGRAFPRGSPKTRASRRSCRKAQPSVGGSPASSAGLDAVDPDRSDSSPATLSGAEPPPDVLGSDSCAFHRNVKANCPRNSPIALKTPGPGSDASLLCNGSSQIHFLTSSAQEVEDEDLHCSLCTSAAEIPGLKIDSSNNGDSLAHRRFEAQPANQESDEDDSSSAINLKLPKPNSFNNDSFSINHNALMSNNSSDIHSSSRRVLEVKSDGFRRSPRISSSQNSCSNNVIGKRNGKASTSHGDLLEKGTLRHSPRIRTNSASEGGESNNLNGCLHSKKLLSEKSSGLKDCPRPSKKLKLSSTEGSPCSTEANASCEFSEFCKQNNLCFFVGEPVPEEEARQRWPYRFLEKEMEEQPPRRSANYAPTLWTDHEIQSLASKTIKEEEQITGRLTILKEHVKQHLQTKKAVDQQLQLIDNLQQLGVAYHFKDDIKSALSALSAPTLEDTCMELSDNLHATALLFSHLREYGFSISEDVFIKFKDEEGLFRANLLDHTDGLLSLYDACYLAKEGEEVMDQALALATQHLTSVSTSSSLEPHWREQVAYALELPRAWRMERLHARWFIEASQRHAAVNPLLLELARLDFNRVQRIYQQELSQLARWWTNLGLVDKLPFFRDRIVETYFLSVGCQFEPQFGTLREALTQQNCIITIIDDAYDVYGSLNELQLFMEVVDRWDVTAIDKLPEYMKLIFLTLFNHVNDVASKVLRDKGLDVIPHLKRAWGDLCKAYLKEAIWYHSGYKPKLEEYLGNAFISVGAPLYIILGYCVSEDLTKEYLELLGNTSGYPIIVRESSLLFRLLGDLGTSSDELQRGDVPKAIQCYMHENNATEDVAREQIWGMIYECWRAMNGDRDFTCCFEENIKRLAINAVGIGHCLYGSKDNYGKPSQSFKQIITSIVLDPIVF